ncbi:MAG: putative acyl-CoA dehydrogenase fadE25 [Acidimicrobiales bacterium]|nr:MAG: acyl-CoA dehydrogenase [Actinomycetota bacterium]MBV6509356.1 putative acyl-CoA dehydrogenase fadE25 [Acidimicrobiales bacterium]RIK04608.1 MAG: acyl-CoA dehydrogenase [Acidobacteriota bacterium]
MGTVDNEVDLTPEEQEVHKTALRFATEVMRPIGEELDKMADPDDVIAANSPLWRVHEKYRELGLNEMEAGTAGDLNSQQQARLRCLIGETLGWGDSGLAISLGVSGFPRMMAMMSGNPVLIERFGDPTGIGCWPITEPDHGSDLIYYGGRPDEMPGQPNCLATKDGDEYVITGQKSAWVSNGTIATAAALFCAVDDGDGKFSGLGGFLVPLDEKGVSRGKPLDKLGQRALNQGEIFFDEVRLPADYLVISPQASAFSQDMILSLANGGMGTCFVGVAQAAYDLALGYAKERVQGGTPIFQHQSVKARLFEMFRKLEGARALNRRAVLYNTLSTPPKLQLAVASKVTSTQVAFEVASEALQIFGGNGLSREYPIEKLLRDARASMIEDGCNHVLSLAAAERL